MPDNPRKELGLKVVEALYGFPVFLFGGCLALAYIVVDYKVAMDEPLSFGLTVVGLLLVCVLLQLIYNRYNPSGHTCLIDEINLVPTTKKILKTFRGDILISNIELQTLRDKELDLWRKFCCNKKVGRIRIALLPHLFARLEVILRNDLVSKAAKAGDTVSPGDFLIDILEKAGDRLVISPIPPDDKWEGVAYCVFLGVRSEEADPQRSKVLLFVKSGPFSTLVGQTRWKYDHIVNTTDQGIIKRCIGEFGAFSRINGEAGDDPNELTIKDLKTLVGGESKTIPEIGRLHSLSKEQIERFTRIVKPSQQNIKTTPSRRDSARTITFKTARGTCKLDFVGSPGEKPRPLAVWLPPWKVPRWSEFTREIDKRLSARYAVAHLQFSNRSDNYTFTGAQQDILDVLQWSRTKDEFCGAHTGEILLLAVSVNAYVAAEIAATWDGGMDLCLLMPGVDLFDSLDNLLREARGTELFTRRFYLGKEGFRANEVGDAVHFFGDARMAIYCFLDFLHRGAKRSDAAYFEDNLRAARERGRILFGHSKRDSMTTWSAVKEVCRRTELSGSLSEISWCHDLNSGVRYVEDIGSSGKRRNTIDSGLDEIVARLLDGANSDP